jgi:hypothetical protein
VSRSSAYKSYGRDDDVVFEAQSQARGFQDVRALSTASLLRQVMLAEEDLIIGGNASQALGVTGTPTLAAAGSGATLPALTYSVICVALTYWGLQFATTVAPLALSTVLAGTNAGKSANATQAVTLGQTLSASVPAIKGAMAYAWFVGAAGSEKLELISPINSAAFSAPLAGTGQAATAITSGDNSTDPLDFDGMISQVIDPTSAAIVRQLPTGTAGTGSKLTSDGAAGIVEIDDMLLAQWNAAKIGPDIIYGNAQQVRDISTKIIPANGAYRIDVSGGAEGQGHMTGGVAVVQYVNKFTGRPVSIKVHPTMPAGTMFFHTQSLPDYYPGERPSGAFDMHMLDEYYEEEYGRV